jgi:hypothetical protein
MGWVGPSISLLMPAHPTIKHKENGMLIDKRVVGVNTVLLIIVVVTWGMFLTGCTSAEDKREYRDAQVQVIGSQVSARTEEGKADAAARAALYAAMAEVARNAPDSADAIAVALAVASVKEEEDSSGAIVQLHREQNEAIEVVKAVAPSLIGVLGTVGVAAMNADVAKTQSRNNAAIQVNDSQQDARIVEAVAGLGAAASAQVGTSVGGDYYVTGGDLDQSTQTSATSSTSNTETTTTNTDSNNVTEAVTNEYVTTDGTKVSLADIQALLANNLEVTVLIDGEEVEVEQCPDGGFTFGGGSNAC